MNFYGQKFARLSRNQAVLYDPARKYPGVSTLAARLSFNLSRKYLLKLDDVFVDHIVYQERWKDLIAGCLKDWTDSLQWVSRTSCSLFGGADY